jgi:hypothetical protein
MAATRRTCTNPPMDVAVRTAGKPEQQQEDGELFEPASAPGRPRTGTVRHPCRAHPSHTPPIARAPDPPRRCIVGRTDGVAWFRVPVRNSRSWPRRPRVCSAEPPPVPRTVGLRTRRSAVLRSGRRSLLAAHCTRADVPRAIHRRERLPVARGRDAGVVPEGVNWLPRSGHAADTAWPGARGVTRSRNTDPRNTQAGPEAPETGSGMRNRDARRPRLPRGPFSPSRQSDHPVAQRAAAAEPGPAAARVHELANRRITARR